MATVEAGWGIVTHHKRDRTTKFPRGCQLPNTISLWMWEWDLPSSPVADVCSYVVTLSPSTLQHQAQHQAQHHQQNQHQHQHQHQHAQSTANTHLNNTWVWCVLHKGLRYEAESPHNLHAKSKSHTNNNNQNHETDKTNNMGNDGAVDCCGNAQIGVVCLCPVVEYNVMHVAATETHCVAITANGRVIEWPHVEAEQVGILEGGSAETDLLAGHVDVKVTVRPLPTRAIRIACGKSHVCVVLASGEVWVWGSGQHGQLGIGSHDTKQTPVMVTYHGVDGTRAHASSSFSGTSNHKWVVSSVVPVSPHLPSGLIRHAMQSEEVKRQIVKVACGAFHTVVLNRGGKVWVWGLGAGGRLGLGNTASVSTPHPLKRATFKGSSISHVYAGPHYSMALTKKGKLFVWGIEMSREQSLVPRSFKPRGAKYRCEQVACGESHFVCLQNKDTLHVWTLSNPTAPKLSSDMAAIVSVLCTTTNVSRVFAGVHTTAAVTSAIEPSVPSVGNLMVECHAHHQGAHSHHDDCIHEGDKIPGQDAHSQWIVETSIFDSAEAHDSWSDSSQDSWDAELSRGSGSSRVQRTLSSPQSPQSPSTPAKRAVSTPQKSQPRADDPLFGTTLKLTEEQMAQYKQLKQQFREDLQQDHQQTLAFQTPQK